MLPFILDSISQAPVSSSSDLFLPFPFPLSSLTPFSFTFQKQLQCSVSPASNPHCFGPSLGCNTKGRLHNQTPNGWLQEVLERWTGEGMKVLWREKKQRTGVQPTWALNPNDLDKLLFLSWPQVPCLSTSQAGQYKLIGLFRLWNSIILWKEGLSKSSTKSRNGIDLGTRRSWVWITAPQLTSWMYPSVRTHQVTNDRKFKPS